MDKAFKQKLILVIIGVALFAALMNLGYVTDFLELLVSLIAPIIIGLLFAFILSVPVSGIEKRIMMHFPRLKKKPLRCFSLAMTLLLVTAAIALICILAIPQLVSSIKVISIEVRSCWPEIAIWLGQYGFDTASVSKWLFSLDWKSAIEHLFTGASSVLGSVVDFAGSTISAVVNILFALVIAIYVLLGSRELACQVNRFLDAFFNENTANNLRQVARLAHTTYAKFLSGQCVEVLILGTLIFLSFSIFGIPYAGLTAALTAVFAFIPYVGAFGSCVIGMLLTLLAAPQKVFLCLIVYVAVQFVENQFIYPHVVGSSVGLSPLWTLSAVLLGGKLFGILGIVFFIPLLAVIAQLMHEQTERCLGKKAKCIVKESESA